MSKYTNIHGQEPSPAAPADFGTPTEAQKAIAKAAATAAAARPGKRPPQSGMAPGVAGRLSPHSRVVARAGREGLENPIKQCQAPTKFIGNHRGRARCERDATVVAVENKPRPDGSVGALALCDLCAKAMLISQGPNYAKVTPL